MRISDWSSDVCSSDLGLPIAPEDRIGEEGKGFYYLLDGLNPERILVASEGISLGKVALARATEYARDRVVFGRPIGQNQAVQHPLADSWIKLEAAQMMMMKAATLYDAGKPCGAEANAAKYLAGEFGFEARSDERRVGKECVGPCRSRWS